MSEVKANRAAKVARVTLTLPWPIWHAVDEMAQRSGCSRAEMVRRCVSTEHRRQRATLDEGCDVPAAPSR